jgi:hypothetical protein
LGQCEVNVLSLEWRWAIMAFIDIFERFFWSLLLTIFIGLIWLKFLDPLIPCISPGLIVSGLVGIIYFYIGLNLSKDQEKVEEIDEDYIG